jgi:Tfp pilus assembly protein PilE
MKRQNGFTVVEGALIVVVVAIAVAVGYLAYTNLVTHKPAETAAVASESSSPSPAAITVQKKADLDTASSALDSVSLDDSDSSQLDSASTSF